MRRTAALAIAGALVLIPTSGPASAATRYSVTVTAYCYSSPERVTIRNNRRGSITVRTIGSTYKPYSAEPYAVYRTLRPGKSMTWRAPRAIFDNDASTEGARVRTSVGTITDRC